MKKLILLLFIPLVSFGQSQAEKDDFIRKNKVRLLNELVKTVSLNEGKIQKTISGNVTILKALNENNSAFVYQFEISDDEAVNNFKKSKLSKETIDELEKYGVSPPPVDYKKIAMDNKKLAKIAVDFNIIFKWRYLYKNKIIKEVIVYPNEWND
jgi:hypothetical protein